MEGLHLAMERLHLALRLITSAVVEDFDTEGQSRLECQYLGTRCSGDEAENNHAAPEDALRVISREADFGQNAIASQDCASCVCNCKGPQCRSHRHKLHLQISVCMIKAAERLSMSQVGVVRALSAAMAAVGIHNCSSIHMV